MSRGGCEGNRGVRETEIGWERVIMPERISFEKTVMLRGTENIVKSNYLALTSTYGET